MATFAELVLEAIEDNYHHTGKIFKIDYDNKIIYINPKKSHIPRSVFKYALRGSNIGSMAGSIFSPIGLVGAGVGAGVGVFNGLYKRKKEQEEIDSLLQAGYKIQYNI